MLKDLTSDTLGFWQLWLQIQHENVKSILICAAFSTTKALSFGMEIFVLGDLNCDLLEGFATHLEPYLACNFTNQGYASIIVFNRFYFSSKHQFCQGNQSC